MKNLRIFFVNSSNTPNTKHGFSHNVSYELNNLFKLLLQLIIIKNNRRLGVLHRGIKVLWAVVTSPLEVAFILHFPSNWWFSICASAPKCFQRVTLLCMHHTNLSRTEFVAQYQTNSDLQGRCRALTWSNEVLTRLNLEIQQILLVNTNRYELSH